MAQVSRPMQAYKRHVASEFLVDRHPYLEDINGHLKQDDVSMAFGDRCFPRLVEQLKSPGMDPDKLSEALRTICDLTAHQENKCVAVATDVVAAATNLLMHDSVEVRREAARVIGSLAHMICGRSCMPIGNQNMPRKLTGVLAPGPTLPRLAKLLLTCDDEIVKMNVARTLFCITVFRDGCQQVVDLGSVKATAQYLCATLPDLPATGDLAMCLLYLLRMLAAVTMYARDGMRDLLGCGLVAKVIAFLGRVPKGTGVPALSAADSTETVRQALRMLWHIGNDPAGRKEMLKAEGVRIVTLYLTDADAKVRESAVCVLTVVSMETQGKMEVLKHSKVGLATLLHSETETTYLHETCVQLCRCASELPAFRFAFARQVLGSIWLLEKIYGTTALAAVSPILDPAEEPELKTQAAVVMAHFLKQPEPAEGDQIRVPPVTPLRHIQQPAAFAIEECTGIVRHLVALLPLASAPTLECFDALSEVPRAREELAQILAAGKLPEGVSDEVRAQLQEMTQKVACPPGARAMFKAPA